ncbi:retrovirus-related pol polyprotein from transposon TNT 1-94 [Tanacetum coccineum]
MIYSGSVTELLSALLHSPSTQLESYFTRSTNSLLGGETLHNVAYTLSEVTLIDETQGRNNEDLMFDTGVLNCDEVFQEPMVNTATTRSSIPDSAVDPVTTADEVVTIASVEILEELTVAQTLFSELGIKREFNVARTPQQNGVAERKNRTLIEAARTMVLVIKPYNKTPYELIRGRPPLIDFMKHFGCSVTILNTRDHLGKFEGKADEGYFVGYFVGSSRIVEETLNIRFLENLPNVKGNGPD